MVTEFELRLAPVGPLVELGAFFFAPEQGARVLHFANELTRGLSDDFGVFIAGLSAPPAPFVPSEWQYRPCYALLSVGFGAREPHAQQADVVRSALRPAFEFVTPLPYTELQKLFDASVPWGIHAYEKALSFEHLSEDAIGAITRCFSAKPTPQCFMPILTLGGAYARAAEDVVAFGGKRSTRFVVNFTGMTDDPAQYASTVEWARSAYRELLPHAASSGSYVNYQVEADVARVRASYGPAKYARLAAIKAQYDPGNLFRLNANIEPEPAASSR